MITAEQYTTITGADAPEDFETQRDLVIADLEVTLNRPLPEQERTEWMDYTSSGEAFPSATPIVEVEEDLPHDDRCIFFTPQPTHGRIQLTYTGGYGDFGDEEADNPLPAPLAQAIAWGVHTLLNPAVEDPDNPLGGILPEGIASMSVGEASASRVQGAVFGADGEPVPSGMFTAKHLGGRACQLARAFRRLR